MAFVQTLEDDEDKDKPQEQQGAEKVLSTGQGSTIPTGGSSTAQSPEGKKASSTGWSNLTQYIDANKGNDVALADKIGSTVDNQATTIKDTQNTLGTKATTDIAKSIVKDSGVISGLNSNPTAVNKDAFAAQRNATYKGPNDTSDYTEYAKQQADLNKFKGTLDNTNSQEGREVLLTDAYKRNDYNQGMKKLDGFILGASEGSKQKIADLNNKYSGVETDWNKFNDEIRGSITGAREATKKTAEATNKAYQDALKATEANVNAAKTSAQTNSAQRQQQFNSLTSNLSNQDPNVRAEAMKQAGIDPSVGEWLMSRGVQPKDLLSQAGGAKVGNFLQDGEAQKYSALMNLDDKQVNEDLTSKGVTDQVFNSDGIKIKGAADAKALQDSLNSQRASKQSERIKQSERLRAKINQGVYDQEVASATGLSQDEFSYARANGINLSNDFRTGATLNVGDVANNDQRKQWGDLKALLGINDNFNIQDTQDEGNAFSYNSGNVVSQIGQKRAAQAAEAERQRVEAEKAAAEAERKRQQQLQETGVEGLNTDFGNPSNPTPQAGAGEAPAPDNALSRKINKFGNWLSGK
jgi:hypothetical protein